MKKSNRKVDLIIIIILTLIILKKRKSIRSALFFGRIVM